jgi:hypothetical protein
MSYGPNHVQELVVGISRVMQEASARKRVFLPPVRDDELRIAMPGTEFPFPTRGTDAIGIAARRGGNTIQLVSLRDRDIHSIWTSCFVAWRKERGQKFSLLTVNWSFFTGWAELGRNQLKLRAEWHEDRNHPQPHWHIDEEVLFSGVDGGHTVDTLSALHLPMAGWLHGTTHPESWSPPRGSVQDVIKWSQRVVELAAAELEYLLESSGY